jgi:hypothetical protein
MNTLRVLPLSAASFAEQMRVITRVLAVAILAWVLTAVFTALLTDPQIFRVTATWRPVTLALTCYVIAHLTRIVRLALLVGNARLGLRRLAAFHLFTSGVALGTPFRLGDLYRAIELGGMTGRLTMGVTFVWIERLFDAAILLPLLAILLFLAVGNGLAAPLAGYAAVTGLTCAFVMVSVLTVALLPDNLRRVGTYLIRRHEDPWTVSVLRVLEETRWTMRRIPSLLRGRIASLAALSMLIWLFEVWGFSIVMLGWDEGTNPVKGLLSFLSQTTSGGVLPQMLPKVALGVLAYLAATQIPLAIVAAVCGFCYLRPRTARMTP